MWILIISLISFHGAGISNCNVDATGKKSIQHDQVLWCHIASSGPMSERDVLHRNACVTWSHKDMFELHFSPITQHRFKYFLNGYANGHAPPNAVSCYYEQYHNGTKLYFKRGNAQVYNILTHKVSDVSPKDFHKALPWQMLLSIRCSTCHLAHLDNETMSKSCPIFLARTDKHW